MSDSDAALSEWPTDAPSYSLLGKIGQGAFATVYKAKIKEEEGRNCAIKVLNLDHVDTNLEEIRQEVQAMRLSSHSNVLTCHTAFVNETQLWLVTPLMQKGSSLHCMQAARRASSHPMEEHILYTLHETLLGLKYIHDNGQIHRDIKAGNILLDGHGNVRIADFGVSGWLVQAGQQTKAQTFVGTPAWMAPEVMEQVHGYDTKADVWSLGITALELAKGYAPYSKYPPMKVLILTIQEDPPSLDTYNDDDSDDEIVEEEFSRDFRLLVEMCLQKDPVKRPTCQDLLEGKFLKKVVDNRGRYKEELKAKVCDIVPDVGMEQQGRNEGPSSPSRRLPGNTPVSIILSQGQDRPAGTTWVFADGSQILSSSAKAATVDDVMEQLDEFGKETGGENYDATTKGASAPKAETTTDVDDLDAFMDEFEQNTAGEDFRHPRDA